MGRRLHDYNQGLGKHSECSMMESEFLAMAEQTLDAIEAAFERAAEAGDLDIESKRTGNVLELEFVDIGSKNNNNNQTPKQKKWVAARSGGFHYKRDGIRWINTRDGTELFAALSDMASMQAGAPIHLSGDS